MVKRSATPSTPRKRFKRSTGAMPPTTAQIARKALALAKANAASVEIKHYDLIGNETPDQGQIAIDLCNPGIGLTDEDRIGQVVNTKRIQVNFNVRAGSATSECNFVRILLVCKKENANFDQATYFANTATSQETVSLRYWDNMSHYKTLYDKVYQLQGGSSPNLSGAHDSISIPVPKAYQRMQWDTANNHEANSLWLVMYSNVATNDPALLYASRVTYSDV